MNDNARELLTLFEQLGERDQQTLLAFAGFLASREFSPSVDLVPMPVTFPAPEVIERPAQESIVAGLKRLSKTYPMLNKSEMLGATSDIVATSLMLGADPEKVIDDLEEIFAAHYRQLQSTHRG
jgi:hypothetical protein